MSRRGRAGAHASVRLAAADAPFLQSHIWSPGLELPRGHPQCSRMIPRARPGAIDGME
jgi:hypothetical protein